LVLFIGELDNENEKGGLLLRSPSVDKPGLHPLERAKYFFTKSRNIAEGMGLEFNWKLEIITYVGRNHRKIEGAAAKYSYGE
jgi:hypothetical protein